LSREKMLLVAKAYGSLLRHADDEARADKEFVLQIVRKNGRTLEYASQALRADRDVVLGAVQQSGISLVHASEELRADKGVVLEAIKQNKWALRRASESVQFDKGFVLEALRAGLITLDCLRRRLQADKEIVLEAVKQRGMDLEWASDALREDLEVVFQAVKQDGFALVFASANLELTEDLILLAARRTDFDFREDFETPWVQDIARQAHFQRALHSQIAVRGEEAPIVTVRLTLDEVSNRFECDASLLSGSNFVCHVEGRSFIELWARRRRLGRPLYDLVKKIVEELPRQTQVKTAHRVFISFVLNEDGDSAAVTPWDCDRQLSDYLLSAKTKPGGHSKPSSEAANSPT